MLGGDDFGEKHQPYSIEASEIASFQSSYAIANAGANRWRVISKEVVQKLAQESKLRVDASSEFAEVYKNLKESEENAGVIRLAEMLKKREEADNKEAEDKSATEQPSEDAEVDGEDAVETAEVAEDEDVISPQLEEATNVLVDLIAFNNVNRTANRTGGIDPR
jgi:hypothetical protein